MKNIILQIAFAGALIGCGMMDNPNPAVIVGTLICWSILLVGSRKEKED